MWCEEGQNAVDGRRKMQVLPDEVQLMPVFSPASVLPLPALSGLPEEDQSAEQFQEPAFDVLSTFPGLECRLQ